jgi:glucosamine--fructose-6-phosphate aminotransferase (isomerizing)
VQETIKKCEPRAKTEAMRFERVSLFFLLGRGANYATALEGALKLKESSNVMAEGHAAREFLHGPLQLVGESTPVMTISTKNDYESLEPLAESFRRLGAPVLWVSEMEAAPNRGEQLDVTGGLSEPLSPLAFIVPIQLFAYHSAVSRGLNPDKPTKLTKVVR